MIELGILPECHGIRTLKGLKETRKGSIREGSELLGVLVIEVYPSATTLAHTDPYRNLSNSVRAVYLQGCRLNTTNRVVLIGFTHS